MKAKLHQKERLLARQKTIQYHSCQQGTTYRILQKQGKVIQKNSDEQLWFYNGAKRFQYPKGCVGVNGNTPGDLYDLFLNTDRDLVLRGIIKSHNVDKIEDEDDVIVRVVSIF